jgi:hypothetical protein
METILVNFQQQHPDIYIGGSVALILQGIIPYRIPKDIDIISPKRIHIFDIFKVDRPHSRIVKRYRHEGFIFDLFINPNAQYIEHIYNGCILKLSPPDEVYQWKLREQNINNQKHIDDLKYYEEFKRNQSNTTSRPNIIPSKNYS